MLPLSYRYFWSNFDDEVILLICHDVLRQTYIHGKKKKERKKERKKDSIIYLSSSKVKYNLRDPPQTKQKTNIHSAQMMMMMMMMMMMHLAVKQRLSMFRDRERLGSNGVLCKQAKRTKNQIK
jgi:hypothetical protein